MKTKGIYQRTTTKICCVCGDTFYPSKAKNRACSRKCGCAIRSGPCQTNQVQMNCTYCGKIFTRNPKVSSGKDRLFCSNICHGEWKSKNSIGERNPNFRNAGWRTCQGCGKQYKNYNKQRKFCGKNCTAKALEKRGMYAIQLGEEYENLCSNLLAGAGWFVLRTKNSRGPFDVVAVKNGRTRFIQVKKTTGYNPPASQWEGLRLMPCPEKSSKEVWINDRNKKWKRIIL